MKIGTLTIGQTPRVDLIPVIRSVLGPDVEIVEKGALDGLNLEEVREFRPRPNEYVLVTRMRDGTEVLVAEERIVERMKQCILEFQTEPVEVIILLCTGEFPEIASEKILLRPDRIMLNVVKSFLDSGRLGVVVPSPDQIPIFKRKWEETQLEVVVDAVSPYTGSSEELIKKANKIKMASVDLVVLDCIGFNQETQALFRETTGKPVLLPTTLVARIAGEMLAA